MAGLSHGPIRDSKPERIELTLRLEYRPEHAPYVWGAEVTNGFTNGAGGGQSPIEAISIALGGLESSILRMDDDLKYQVMTYRPPSLDEDR